MKRDLMVIYRILEKVESSDFDSSEQAIPIPVILPGVPPRMVQYHFLLLQDAGFIETICNEQGMLAPTRLTWKGHDYLDHASDVVIDSVENLFAEAQS